MPRCCSQRSGRLAIARWLLLWAIVFPASFAFGQQQAGSGLRADPTKTSTEMEEVLRALRSNNETAETEAAPAAMPVERLSLAGLVVSGRVDPNAASGTAIFRVGNSFLLAREGQTLENANRVYTIKSINTMLVLLEEAGGEQLVLRSQQYSPSRGNDLAILEMQDVPLYLAARAISDETGLSIAASADARDTPVNLYLRDVEAADAFDTLVLTHKLYMSEVPGARIVRLHTAEEYARDASSFGDEITKVFTLKYPNSRDVALAIRDLFGDRVRLASRIDDEDEPGEHLTEDLQQRLERFDIIDARGQGFGIDGGGQGAQVGRALTNRFDNDRFSRNSRSFRNLNRLGENFGTDTDRFDRLSLEEGLTPEEISALESGDPAAIEQAVQQRADIYVTVIDRLNKVMVRTRDEKTMEDICELVCCLDVPTPLVLLEVKIMEVALERGLDTAFDWNISSGTWSGGFNTTEPATVGDLVFTYLDNSFQSQIRMLQRGNKLTVLGKPMLLTANNEVSRLFIGEEVPLNRNFQGGQTVVTVGGSIVSASNTDIEFRPVGSTLLITPNINDDRTVSLRVLQEESRIVEGGADVLVPDAGGGFINRSIDTVASQTASGTFVARDRETIAVGGMITESLVSQRSQIPVLGDIPGVGLLARNQRLGRERKEIVLLLTPHIIKTAGEGEAVSQELVERNSFHPNKPSGDGQLGSFVEPNVLTTSSEEFGPLEKIQERQVQEAWAQPVGKSPAKKKSGGWFFRGMFQRKP